MGENPTKKQLKKDIPLGEALKEVMNLAKKYNFTLEDSDLLGCRLLAFGEAVALITDMGMYEEYVKHVREKIRLLDEIMTNKFGDDIFAKKII